MIRSRAFAVWFEELDRWDPSSFHDIAWHWPKHVMHSIGDILRLRKEKVDRKSFQFADLQPITIHFDGTVDKRKVDANREYTMDLWFARPGDIVVAKIDLKNGAVCIVPDDWHNVVVTGHFAVYEPDRNRLLPEYLHLVIQTSFYKAHLWRNKVGAEGRKEVKLDFFESDKIPLPPLSVQQAIVDRWQQAKAKIAAANTQAEQIKSRSTVSFLSALGFDSRAAKPMPKAFAVNWSDLFTWNGRATFLSLTQGDVHRGKFPVVRGADCLAEVCHGCSASPSPRPTALEVLKISAVTRGEFVPSEKKYAFDIASNRKQFALRKGDILLCRTNGTLAYVGMSALVMEDMPGLIFPDKVIRVRVKENIQSEYLWLILQTPPLRAQIEAAARTAVGNYAIGGKDIWNFEIPLPPVNIQRALVDEVIATRAEIARIRESAEQLAQESKADIEAMILGTKRP